MKLNNEQIAISLEVLAFFFVTLDLYGKERVERLSERMHREMQLEFNWIRKNFSFGRTRSLLDYVVIGALLYGAAILLTWFINHDLGKYGSEWMRLSIQHLNNFEVFLGKWMFLISAGCVVIYCGFFVSIFTTAAVGRWLLGRLKLEGVMLTVGTVMFVASKETLI
jgi:hypothetical protein